MKAHLLLAFVVSVRALRLGPLRLTPYGLCATGGVILGMALAGRLARRVGVDPEAVWDAGLLAVISCFAASRLLLVLRDPHAFRLYPLTVLALPSLTYGGLLLAAVFLLAYLRWRRLPTLAMLDVFAAPGCLLAAALELGHLLDGSEPGMPVGYLQRARPWDLHALHLYPVAALGTLTAAVLCFVLVRQLLTGGKRPGQVAASGLMLGGATAAILSMLSLPEDAVGSDWLEPGQTVALLACVAGGLLWQLAPNLAAGEKILLPEPEPNRLPGDPNQGSAVPQEMH